MTFRKQNDVEGIRAYVDARGVTLFLGFWRLGQWSLDLPYALAILFINERWPYHARQQHVNLELDKQAKLGFPTAAGGRRRLGVIARAQRMQSCGGGSDPGPLPLLHAEVERGLRQVLFSTVLRTVAILAYLK